jgi:hypothetical protein
MTTNIPEQPAAPDYAKATKEGIYTDISTLPLRKQIDTAARTGSKISYIDPATGQEAVADFSGQADWDSYAKRPELQQWYKEATARGEKWNSMADFAQDYYNNIGQAKGDEVGRVNTGSDAEIQRIAIQNALDGNQLYQRQQLDLRKELGVDNAEQTRKELEAGDPEGFRARNALVQRLNNDVNSAPSDIKGSQVFGQLADRMRSATSAAPHAGSGDPTDLARSQLLKIAIDDAERGGKLDDASRNEVVQASRAALAARGNFLGNSAAVAEAQEVGQKAEDRRLGALGRLASAQGNSYNQLQGYYNNQLQGMQAESQLSQAQVGEDRATRQENYGRDQQKLSNISSMILGQPISNQFGNLGAAQQGAVGFMNFGANQGIGVNGNAGQQSAGFAQQNYGQAANMWNTQANLANSNMQQLVGLGAGAAGLGIAAMM